MQEKNNNYRLIMHSHGGADAHDNHKESESIAVGRLPEHVMTALRERGQYVGPTCSILLTSTDGGETFTGEFLPHRTPGRRASDLKELPLSKPETERQLKDLIRRAKAAGFELEIRRGLKPTVTYPRNREEWERLTADDYEFIPYVTPLRTGRF